MISSTVSVEEWPSWPLSDQPGRNQRRDFERLALPHLSNLYRSALYLTRDEAEAEDLVQETSLRAYRFFEKFAPGTNIKAWLLSIQNNLFINRYRQKKRQPETLQWDEINETYDFQAEPPGTGLGASPEDTLSFQGMDDEVEAALKSLPEEFRTAIVLVDIENLRYDEAAMVMETPIGTVRSRVSRGRRMLQRILKNYAVQRGLLKRSVETASSVRSRSDD